MAVQPTEQRYPLSLTLRQLYILSEQMSAVADPGHRAADELALLELIERTYKRARARSLRKPSR